jgi:hypothetical protein
MPSQSIPDHHKCRSYPLPSPRRIHKLRGQQLDSGPLNAPPAAAHVPRRTPSSGIATTLTRYARIFPTGARYRIAAQPSPEIPGYSGTADRGTGRKPFSTRHRQPLATADATIMELPGPAAAKGKP